MCVLTSVGCVTISSSGETVVILLSQLNGSTGVGNANLEELKEIASDPDDSHVYTGSNFTFLRDIVVNLIDDLCNDTGKAAHFSGYLYLFK